MIIKITEPAFKNIEDIKDYIKQDSAYYADIFTNSIFSSIEKLERFPLSGRIVPEYNIKSIREIIFQNYRIIYKLPNSEDIIYILTVIHGSRKIKKHIKKKDLNNI
jgi:toxin ParE1/3/4